MKKGERRENLLKKANVVKKGERRENQGYEKLDVKISWNWICKYGLPSNTKCRPHLLSKRERRQFGICSSKMWNFFIIPAELCSKYV